MEGAVKRLIEVDLEITQHKEKEKEKKSPEFKSLLDHASNARDFLFRSNPSHLEQIYNSLGDFPPNKNFFLWLSLLEFESSLPVGLSHSFVRRIQQFLSLCDKDLVKYAPNRFADMLNNFTNKAIEAKQPSVAIRALKLGVAKMSVTSEHLTPAHPLLMKVCLLSKNYKAALPALEKDLTEIDPTKTGLKPLDAVLFFYYGGMIFIGMKLFRRAQDFFVLAISSPAQALSAVVIDCHRKFVLVSLILDGQVPNLPKYTASFVLRQLKTVNTAYLDFAKAFQSQKIQSLKESLEKSSKEFETHKNLGLANQVVEAMYRKNILRLTQTYVTLSLSQIATLVGFSGEEEAENYLLRMVVSGEIHGQINQKDKMVKFGSNPEEYNTNRMMQHIDHDLANAARLGHNVDALKKVVLSSHQYIQKVLQNEKGFQNQEEALEAEGKYQGNFQAH